MKSIPENIQDLLRDDVKAYLFLGTLMPDGSPQVTPVWFNTDGEHILINSAKGRIKDRNMRRDPRVALCIQDPSNPFRYLQIRGRIIEVTETGADDHIDALMFKYRGERKYPWKRPGEIRVKYTVQVEKVDAHG